MSSVTVCVPYRYDWPERLVNVRHAVATIHALLPSAVIHMAGELPEPEFPHVDRCFSRQPWSKTELCNLSLAHCHTDNWALVDADVLLTPDSADNLVQPLPTTHFARLPYTRVIYGKHGDTPESLFHMASAGGRVIQTQAYGYALVADAARFRAFGGLFEQFTAVGFEDLAMKHYLAPPVIGTIAHLWHPPILATPEGQKSLQRMAAIYDSQSWSRTRPPITVKDDQ